MHTCRYILQWHSLCTHWSRQFTELCWRVQFRELIIGFKPFRKLFHWIFVVHLKTRTVARALTRFVSDTVSLSTPQMICFFMFLFTRLIDLILIWHWQYVTHVSNIVDLSVPLSIQKNTAIMMTIATCVGSIRWAEDLHTWLGFSLAGFWSFDTLSLAFAYMLLPLIAFLIYSTRWPGVISSLILCKTFS